VIFSEFIVAYKEGVKTRTGAVLSNAALGKILNVKAHNIDKWIQRGNVPSIDAERINVKIFFGIENFGDISEETLKDAIERYPKGLAKVVDIKNPSALKVPLGAPQSNEDHLQSSEESINSATSKTNTDMVREVLEMYKRDQAIKEIMARTNEKQADATIIANRASERLASAIEKLVAKMEGETALHVK
jgi:hypothetical protein